MQNLQTNEALLQNFQVEELEERLENKWNPDKGTRCPSHPQDGACNEDGGEEVEA